MPFDSTDHYENFPVGSILLPAHLRRPVAVIYRYARSADDIADEGDADPATRLAELARYRLQLDRIAAGDMPDQALFRDVAEIVQRHALPLAPFYDLIDAFAQDVVKTRYADFSDLMEYCRRSADPIGRLLLHLFDQATTRNVAWSDAICSSLQLTNFYQDIAIDWRKNRIYLPRDEMCAYGVSEAHVAEQRVDKAWRRLMRFQIARSRAMLESGAPLGRALPGRMGWEIRAIIAGGATVLDKLDACDGEVFRLRPTLQWRDWLRMMRYTLFPETLRTQAGRTQDAVNR
jgi:phytoene synthase